MKKIMATITRLEEMEIWQLSRKLAKEVWRLVETEAFKYEFGLKQQMKNSSGSVMDNIAEGFGRGSKHEFVNSLTIAKGSAEELKSQLIRCSDCELVNELTFKNLLDESEVIIKKTGALIHYLNRVPIKGQKFKERL